MGKLKGDLGKLDNILRNYHKNKTEIDCYKLRYKIFKSKEQKNKEILQEMQQKIDLLIKQDLNIRTCLQMLDDRELKFINEVYCNHKTYGELIPLIKELSNCSTNVYQVILNNGSTIKRIILNKLLKLNILGDKKNDS
ncbi:hypothetical protein FDB41_00640 [Clostridium botulinum]|nr:hypothetical protein [Clostridium botulinum]NFO52079.1 hypothetical protein [Clostridium botulinum]